MLLKLLEDYLWTAKAKVARTMNGDCPTLLISVLVRGSYFIRLAFFIMKYSAYTPPDINTGHYISVGAAETSAQSSVEVFRAALLEGLKFSMQSYDEPLWVLPGEFLLFKIFKPRSTVPYRATSRRLTTREGFPYTHC